MRSDEVFFRALATSTEREVHVSKKFDAQRLEDGTIIADGVPIPTHPFFRGEFGEHEDDSSTPRRRKRKQHKSPLAMKPHEHDMHEELLSDRAGQGRSGKREPSRVRIGSRKDRRMRVATRGLTVRF